MEKFYTRVIFKMTPSFYSITPDVIAFLLDVEANRGFVMSYEHVGQHGEASFDFLNECAKATEDQYKDLKEELESLGYEFEVCENLP